MTKSHALSNEGRPAGHAGCVFPVSPSLLCGPCPETSPIRLSTATAKDAANRFAGNSATHNETMYAPFELAIYCRVIENESEDAHTYAMLMHDLPRRFHLRSREEQAAFLQERPRLTHTRWDALLAAVVEHIARLHDLPVPGWVDEPERFLATPWVISQNPVTAADSVLYAPGAFIRHGALPDPLDLDARGGEKHAWVP